MAAKVLAQTADGAALRFAVDGTGHTMGSKRSRKWQMLASK